MPPSKQKPVNNKAKMSQGQAFKAVPGSALTPQARAFVEGFIAAVQRNPAAAIVALGALALGVMLIFG
jgi:hypothetical protein